MDSVRDIDRRCLRMEAKGGPGLPGGNGRRGTSLDSKQ